MARKKKIYRAVVGLTHDPTGTEIPAGELIPADLFTKKQIDGFLSVGAVKAVD